MNLRNDSDDVKRIPIFVFRMFGWRSSLTNKVDSRQMQMSDYV